MKKVLILLITLAPVFAKADEMVISLLCFEESDYTNTTHNHEPLIVDVKRTDDNMGYAVTKFLPKDNYGSVRHGLTYFKSTVSEQRQKDHPNNLLFTTRQNPDDLGKDADFLGFDFTDIGTKKTPIYRAIIGRGHDNVIKQTLYYCGLNN